jgi:hypothetical protein
LSLQTFRESESSAKPFYRLVGSTITAEVVHEWAETLFLVTRLNPRQEDFLGGASEQVAPESGACLKWEFLHAGINSQGKRHVRSVLAVAASGG